MCLRHWRLVPADLQRAVWNTYRPGQCNDKRPSPAWHAAARAAIQAVALADRFTNGAKVKKPEAQLSLGL